MERKEISGETCWERCDWFQDPEKSEHQPTDSLAAELQAAAAAAAPWLPLWLCCLEVELPFAFLFLFHWLMETLLFVD